MSLMSLKQLRTSIFIGTVSGGAIFLSAFYFSYILLPIISYIYFGVLIVATVAAVLLFGAAIIYPFLVDVYYRIVNILRAVGLIYLVFG